jgi:hypothetical protein
MARQTSLGERRYVYLEVSHGPFVLFGVHRTHQSDHGDPVGEGAGGVGAQANLSVQLLWGIVTMALVFL